MKAENNLNLEEIITQTLYPVSPPEATHRLSSSSLPEVLIISTYPPSECGIATYTHDLLKALNNKFGNSFTVKICALESVEVAREYPDEVKYVLNSSEPSKFVELAYAINTDRKVKMVLIQHEFGLFKNQGQSDFLQLLYGLTKPVIIAFHTVLPSPNQDMRAKVNNILAACDSVIVMTQNAAALLKDDYGISENKIEVIAHGTHLVPHLDKKQLKQKYGFKGLKVLTTFGLLGVGKGIETTLDALPAVVAMHPEVMFLIIGKTHPSVIKLDGEAYREMLEDKIQTLGLQAHVRFVNRYLPLKSLLEYLQMTDIYLFTSKDPNQAVSGTFSYAMSCGCPIISTPIPHAREVLTDNTGIIIDFQNPRQLSQSINLLLGDEALRIEFSQNSLERIVPTSWENSAIAHALLFQKVASRSNVMETLYNKGKNFSLQYRLPPISVVHVKKMTTYFGIIQFSKINQPDIASGYTLDDNARALVAMCMHYEYSSDESDMNYIRTYLDFIKYCMTPDGSMLNYVDVQHRFTAQNDVCNLSDANGRAIWALGFVISMGDLLPFELIEEAEELLALALPQVDMMHSTRAMAFTIKGLCYANAGRRSADNTALILTLSNRLVQMYRHESEPKWQWFESYLTYANSILPEALLFAYQETGVEEYQTVAKSSFDFLLSQTFTGGSIKVISNKSWMYKGEKSAQYGEQPIDIAYTILALSRFGDVYKEHGYSDKLSLAFNWFLGHNHLHQIVYNPCTGGCFDGLEEHHINLNQGAESTLSYLMARLCIEEHRTKQHQVKRFLKNGQQHIVPSLSESSLKKITNEIFMVTNMIQKEFPELYKLLSETPLFISYNKNNVENDNFEHYLESLKSQLEQFRKANIKSVVALHN